MIIKVSKGYVSYDGEMYGVGKTIELPDGAAKNLITQGVVVEAGELPASDIEPVLDDEESSELEDIAELEDDEEEVEEAVAELPAVEPEQTVSKSSDKANSKGTGKTGGKGKGGNTRGKKA